jgi:hypothetical protein
MTSIAVKEVITHFMDQAALTDQAPTTLDPQKLIIGYFM